MARYTISTSITLAAATEKTAIQVIAPSTGPIVVRNVTIADTLAGSTDEGVHYRLTTALTGGTGTSATPVPELDAAAFGGTAKVNYSAEPSTGTEVELYANVVPAGGGVDKVFETPSGFRIAASGVVNVRLKSTQVRTTAPVFVSLEIEQA